MGKNMRYIKEISEFFLCLDPIIIKLMNKINKISLKVYILLIFYYKFVMLR